VPKGFAVTPTRPGHSLRGHTGAKSLSALGDLNVAKGHGQSVCGIGGLRRLGHAQQRADHLLHLFFSRMPVAGDRSLDLPGRIAKGRNAGLRGSEKNYAANLREPQGRLHIESRKNGFQRHGPGLKFLNQFGNPPMDVAQMTIRSS